MAATVKTSGFKTLDKLVIPTRIIVSVEAVPGCGKTAFGLGAARTGKTVYLQRLDLTSEEPLRIAQREGLDVRVKDYDVDQFKDEMDASRARSAAQEVFGEFCNDFRQIIADGAIPVWDTATEVWELARLAQFGKTTQVLPNYYSSLNAKFMHLLKVAVMSPSNFVMVHKMKDEWENYTVEGKDRSRKTGNLKRLGFGDIEFAAHCRVQVYRSGMYGDPNGEDLEPSRDFMMRIIKCNPKADLVGMDIPIDDPLGGFDVLGQLIFEEEWGG